MDFGNFTRHLTWPFTPSIPGHFTSLPVLRTYIVDTGNTAGNGVETYTVGTDGTGTENRSPYQKLPLIRLAVSDIS